MFLFWGGDLFIFFCGGGVGVFSVSNSLGVEELWFWGGCFFYGKCNYSGGIIN